MKLIELEPQFIRHEIRPCHVGAEGCSTISEHTQHVFHVYVDTLAEAQGIFFLCPKDFELNKGPIGTHGIICWFLDRGVPTDAEPLPGRWAVSGSSYEDLTLSPSVLTTEGCGWHGFITGGAVTSC